MKLDTGTRKIKSYTMADLLRTLIRMIPAPDERPAVIPRQEFHVQDKMEEVLHLLRKRKVKNRNWLLPTLSMPDIIGVKPLLPFWPF